MRAVRDNELAAGVVGIDVFRTKVSAFALSAVLGGLAGGLFAGGFSYVSPDQFSFAESVVFLTMSLLGGVASPIGSAIGTGLLILIPEWLRFLKSVPGLYLAIYGLSVILIIRYMPDLGFRQSCYPAVAQQDQVACRGSAVAAKSGYRGRSHRSSGQGPR
jgi:branched-chain amino acid transport system permease protein